MNRKSADHANADALSRLPQTLGTGETPVAEEAEIFYFMYLDELPITEPAIREVTRKDPLFSRVHHPECEDTYGTFVEAPALNLKANQETMHQTIEKMA